MNRLRRALNLVGEHRRAYLVMNLVYYGLVAVAIIGVAFNRDVQETLLKAVKASIDKGPLSPVGSVYLNGRLLGAIGITFAINLLGGSFASITLPSLVIPFSGLLVGAWRAVLWGVMFAPTTLAVSGPRAALGGLIALLVFLEGQAYVLTMLAAYIQGKAFLFPSPGAAATRWQRYKDGVKNSLQLYWLIALQLAVAAIYEAILAILIVPLLA